ncbi:MAG: DNA-3-methyladenine glycosylase [Acidimicrobiales bacterium]
MVVAVQVDSAFIDTALPVDLRRTLVPTRRGGTRDPSVQFVGTDVWRATRTPDGAVTINLRPVGPTRVEMRAWGPGASWAVGSGAALVGAADGDGGLPQSAHPLVRDLARRFRGLRFGATGDPFEALVPTILEQKVQGISAKASYRAMVSAQGALAPMADVPGAPRLLLPPSAEWLRDQPSWAWHRWGVEAKRAVTIRTAASYAHRIRETVDMTPAQAAARLRALPGVGPWSVAEVAQVAFGDPDAVSVGDYWLCHWVCHNLAGTARGTDAQMLELLGPWAGQRGRVCRLLMLGGASPPRFGPRLDLQPIAHL